MKGLSRWWEEQGRRTGGRELTICRTTHCLVHGDEDCTGWSWGGEEGEVARESVTGPVFHAEY